MDFVKILDLREFSFHFHKKDVLHDLIMHE